MKGWFVKYRFTPKSHYPRWWWIRLFKNFTRKKSVTFKCFFDKSCFYKFNDVDDYDINKLFGLSTTLDHHIQSARIGWRVKDNTFELTTYSYTSGKRDAIKDIVVLGHVKQNELFECKIVAYEDYFYYELKTKDNKKTHIIPKDPSYDGIIGRYLEPYFGGNRKPPHNMFLFIKRKKSLIKL